MFWLPLGSWLLKFALACAVFGLTGFFVGESLPRRWFSERLFLFQCFSWEKGGLIYRHLRVQNWKLRFPDMSRMFRFVFQKRNCINRDSSHMDALIRETCRAEFVHWVLVLISPAFHLFLDTAGWLGAFLFASGNLAPIVIQRYNRPRLISIRDKICKSC